MATQTQAVRDHLIEHGYIDVHEALFGGLQGMHPTRIAAIVWNLRHKDRWNIKTIEAPGKLAKYVLLARPGHPDDWEKSADGVADAEGLPEPHDPDDDVPGFHGMPPDEETPAELETRVREASRKASDERKAAARYDCTWKGCVATVVRVEPSRLTDDIIEATCVRGHKTFQRRK